MVLVSHTEVGDERADFKCVCSNIDEQGQIPPCVGNDYFCDPGNSNFGGLIFYADNMLLLQQSSMVLQGTATAHH
jgi:hypothetical protein